MFNFILFDFLIVLLFITFGDNSVIFGDIFIIFGDNFVIFGDIIPYPDFEAKQPDHRSYLPRTY
jgi:hypothetical protein